MDFTSIHKKETILKKICLTYRIHRLNLSNIASNLLFSNYYKNKLKGSKVF